MKKLYIRGLVKVADTVRRELSQPLSPGRRAGLRCFVRDSMGQVDQILARHGAVVGSLPAPTRRAYQFLATLDLDITTSQPGVDAEPQARGSVSLTGLRSFFDGVLRGLAQPVTPAKAGEVYRSIRSAGKDIDDHMKANDLKGGDLTAKSRSMRSWLVFFSDRVNFDAYLAAMTRARPIFDASLQDSRRFREPAFVEFRPIVGLYRVRAYRDGTRVVLAAPMICFSEELFVSLANAMFNGGSKQTITEACSGEEFEAIQAELEVLSGTEERVAGVHRDLAASFERVCEKYFGGTLDRPRLTWSIAFTGCKFGHYNPVHDAVMVSSTLDQEDVPEVVLDFIMYHELLHKKLGVGWQNGRRAVHTPEFRAEEKRFEHYAVAEAALKRLAKRNA